MSFEAVRGQDHAVGLLREALASGRLAPAYLFHGPEGVGKRMTALAFAKAALCRGRGDPPDACGACPSCLRFEAGSHEGLLLLERAADSTQIRLEQVHDLCARLVLRTMEGERKVAVIDEADRSNAACWNALLKTLEEPPPGATIVLVTSRRDVLPETIRSRCQTVRFRPLPEALLREILERVLRIDETGAGELARLARGSPGRARRLEEWGFRDAAREIERWVGPDSGDPLRAAAVLAALARKGGRAEEGERMREILLVLLDLLRARTLHPPAGEAVLAEAAICYRALWRGLDNLSRNVNPEAALQAALIEVLPRWRRISGT